MLIFSGLTAFERKYPQEVASLDVVNWNTWARDLVLQVPLERMTGESVKQARDVIVREEPKLGVTGLCIASSYIFNVLRWQLYSPSGISLNAYPPIHTLRRAVAHVVKRVSLREGNDIRRWTLSLNRLRDVLLAQSVLEYVESPRTVEYDMATLDTLYDAWADRPSGLGRRQMETYFDALLAEPTLVHFWDWYGTLQQWRGNSTVTYALPTSNLG